MVTGLTGACHSTGSNGPDSGFATGPDPTTGGDSSGSDTSGGPEGACAAIDAEVLDCEQMNAFALALPVQPPGCDGGEIAEPEWPDNADAELPWLGSWPGRVTETDPALVGVWTTLVANEVPLEGEAVDRHLPIHSIHRPTGKFLQFGGNDDEDDGNWDQITDKVIWYPPQPCLTIFEDGIESCDTTFDFLPETAAIESHYHVNQEDGDPQDPANPDMTQVSLFCAGHVNAPPEDLSELEEPRTITVGGSAPENVNQAYPGAFLFRESVLPTGLPVAEDAQWVQVDDLQTLRWYPTATVLANGQVAVSGGVFSNTDSRACRESEGAQTQFDEDCDCEQVAGDPYHQHGLCGDDGFCIPVPDEDHAAAVEQYGYVPCESIPNQISGVEVGTRDGDSVAWTQPDQDSDFKPGGYPFMFVLPDLPHFAASGTNLGGKLVHAGGEGLTSFTALLVDPTLSASPQPLAGPSCIGGSSAVMFAEDRIMKFGGVAAGAPTSRLTEILDLSSACPVWRRPEGSLMAQPRHYSQGVLLPDGNVMAAGGSLSDHLGDIDDASNPDFDERSYGAFTAELFDRDTETWCRLADLPGTEANDYPTYRGYHAQSFLLPDGRVYLGAGGRTNEGGENPPHCDYQIFAPPYLFRGSRPIVSPDDVNATTVNGITAFGPGGSAVRFARDNDVPVGRVTLVKLSSSTHAFDQEQRFVELDWALAGEDDEWLDITPPPSTCYATPGYYMLFVISAESGEPDPQGGVPSIGHYVWIDGTCAAADVPADAPVYPDPAPVAYNARHEPSVAGLRVSCSGPGATLSLDDLGRGLVDLCAATRACPTTGEVTIEIRYSGGTGSTNVDVDDLLSAPIVTFADGVPSFLGDPMELSVAGSGFTTSVDLGPGDHELDVCATLGSLSACARQPLRIEPVLAEDLGSDYRAGEIEVRALDLDVLAPGGGLALGDDDVVAVALPDGFEFSFFDETVDTLWVGANGGVRISNGDIPATNTGLPSSLGPHIAVYWDDLDPSVAGRVVAFDGGDRFVVAWDRVAVAAGGRVSAQLHLLRDGRIELHYPNVGNGASAFGASATIGIQADGDALELSDDDDGLLSGASALAIDRTSCVASALRFVDSTPCADRPAVVPNEIEVCGVQTTATLAKPALPTTCAAHTGTFLRGRVWQGAERQLANASGAYTLFPGNYTAQWSMLEPHSGLAYASLAEVGEAGIAPITVSITDDSDVCCRPEQTTQILTAGNDGPMNVCTTGACCAIALAGRDNLSSGGTADTLLGGDGIDTLYGGGGNDVLAGGVGGDWLSGGYGNDTVLGGEGDDSMVGDQGDDVMHGGPGHDLVVGKDGNDQLWGCAGDDDLLEFAYTGAEIILPGPGADEVRAGAGDDAVFVLDLCEVSSGEILDGGSGTDVLWLPAGVTTTDLTNLGATVTGFETVSTIVGQPWGGSECAA